jgi:DNA-binding LacI/PurR family transcriptional regulator
VFSGASRVSDDLYEHVNKAARDLGIDLRRENTGTTLVFVLSNRQMLHVFHSRIFFGAQEYCKTRGVDVLFLSLDYSPLVPWNELVLPKLLRRQDVVQAAILAGTNSENLLVSLRQQGIPFAILGNNILDATDDYYTVDSDDVQGAFDLTSYLQGLGHKDVWFVGNTALPWFARCYRGYSLAMEKVGAVPRLSKFESVDEREAGYLGTRAILSKGEPVTAIFAGTDTAAQGVYSALEDCRVRIPQDISVVGCNDTCGELLRPSLTTIREFPEQLGKHLAELAIGQVARTMTAPRRISIPTAIVKRDSCQAPSESCIRKELLFTTPRVLEKGSSDENTSQ